MPGFGLEGASAILANHLVSLFLLLFQLSICILYVLQTQGTNSTIRAVQSACSNELAITLCTAAARQQSRKQDRAVFAVASYYHVPG